MKNKDVTTWDDFPDYIKELVRIGIYTKEEVIMRFEQEYKEDKKNYGGDGKKCVNIVI